MKVNYEQLEQRIREELRNLNKIPKNPTDIPVSLSCILIRIDHILEFETGCGPEIKPGIIMSKEYQKQSRDIVFSDVRYKKQ